MVVVVVVSSSADGFWCRVEPYGPDYEFAGVLVYGLGGVVG